MKDGKLLRFLQKPLISGLLKSVPLVGDVASNVLSETAKAPAGQVDKNELAVSLVRLAILAGLLYLVFSGKIDFDQAEQAKDFLED